MGNPHTNIIDYRGGKDVIRVISSSKIQQEHTDWTDEL